ncbi:dynamin family protein [Streptosporangium sp. NPDC087985]|uniref:dynamin family protein n=1 Tax=Streptosporangium sp. NPDC087985 TaxID=3366196 RepID=UPI00382DAAAD
MKSAANKPTHPSERDHRLAGPSQESPGGTSPGDAEFPVEQTVTFRAIRPDDDAASASHPQAAGRGDTPAPDDPLAAFRAAAAAAEATIASLTGDAAAPPRGDERSTPPRGSGAAAPSSQGSTAASPGAGGTSRWAGGTAATSQEDAFAAFRAAAAAAEATIASLTGGEDSSPPTGRKNASSGDGDGAAPFQRPPGAGEESVASQGGGVPARERDDAAGPSEEDAFAAFRAAAAAAEATIASLTGPAATSREEDAAAGSSPVGGTAAASSPGGAFTAFQADADGPLPRPERGERAAGPPGGVPTGPSPDGASPTSRAGRDAPLLRVDREEEPGADFAGAGAALGAGVNAGLGGDVLGDDVTGSGGVDIDDVTGSGGVDIDDVTRSGDLDIDGDDAYAGEEAEWTRHDRVREAPLPDAVSEALTSALTILRASVTDLRFGLDLPGAEEARRTQSEILTQLDDYVLPRVRTSTAPALVVVAGSTGAGKSTLLNTLANAKVSATGVRRPTTGTPVLACHPDDYEWFAEGDTLGSLRRQDAPDPKATPGSLVLVSTERLPPGVALLDTPDIDSVVEEHHEIAHRMLDTADLWIFVTTAARYADAPAWRLLRLAKERGVRLVIVLSRVAPKSREVVTKHFFRMLTEYGLGDVARFVIDESKVTDGMLPDHEVTELRLWLTELSVDDQRRAQAVRATLSGVLDSFRTRIPALARQLEAQVVFRSELRGDVDAAYAGALAEIEEATGNGSLLRGEVLARWQDFAGSGDLMRTLHLRKPGRFAGKAGHQAPERLSALKAALRAAVESVIISAAQRAAEEVVSRWLHRSGAGETLAAAPGLGHASDELLRRTGRTVAAWQEHIIELIRTEGVTKRAVARLVSFDVESLSLIFAIGLLGDGSAETEGVVTGALPKRLVHALLGAESLRTIGAKARSDLRARISMLFDDEMSRYVQVLDGAGIPDESAATRLHQATYTLEVAR